MAAKAKPRATKLSPCVFIDGGETNGHPRDPQKLCGTCEMPQRHARHHTTTTTLNGQTADLTAYEQRKTGDRD